LQQKFQRRKSVEEIFAPLLIAVADQPHELAGSVKSERTRTPLELQACLLGRAVTLIVVAGITACHQIFP
jgi:hypothetical protein